LNTDTGRRWDGWKVSIRDKVEAKRRSGFRRMPQQEKWIKKGLVFHSTNDIIWAVETGEFPDKVMFTFHPQRWHTNFIPWAFFRPAFGIKPSWWFLPGLLFAAGSEGVQYLLPYRAWNINDLVANSLGVVFGFGICMVFRAFRKQPKTLYMD